MRVRIFIDFWNFTLDMKDFNPTFRIDYEKLPLFLTEYATTPRGVGIYEGTTVYASIHPQKPTEAKLKDFLSNTLNRMIGYQVKIFERKPAATVRCPECGYDIVDCPGCSKKLKRMVEKGVDAAMVTDMLQLAWDNTYDTAVMLTSDKDFIPMVNFLNTRGKKIVHASFTPQGRELASACWKQINLSQHTATIAR